MNEDAARDVLLVRAIESTAASQHLLGAADRLQAGRTAAELARWQANATGTAPAAEVFVARRAGLLLDKLAPTQPALAHAARALAWRPAIGVALVIAALLVGLGAGQIADRQHVNILAFPLLAIVGWNLGVYLLLALRGLRWMVAAPARRSAAAAAAGGGANASAAPAGDIAGASRFALGALRRVVVVASRRALGAGGGGPLAPALGRFGTDWSHAMAPLAAARAARLLHLAAVVLAVGAVLALYLRGLVFDYRIGWESTFLGAEAVQALLATVLGPAAALLGMPFPGVAAIAAIRFPASASGAQAAGWIHLHALTVLLAVVLPRSLLCVLAALRERRLARHVPVGLEAPYFRRLLGPFLRGEVRLRVVPYSYAVDETATAGLRSVARRLLGDDAQLAVAAVVAYGAEGRAADGLVAGDPQVPLTLALFSLAATPEAENHGAFLARLRSAVAVPPVAALAVLVDEHPWRRRLGVEAGTGAAARLAERRQAWQAFAASHGLALACVDLAAPDLDGLEQRLEPALAGRPAEFAVPAVEPPAAPPAAARAAPPPARSP